MTTTKTSKIRTSRLLNCFASNVSSATPMKNSKELAFNKPTYSFQADRPRGFDLCGVDRLEPPAEDLTLVCTGVDRHGERPGNECQGLLVLESRVPEEEHGPYEHNLDEQRSPSHEFDVSFGHPPDEPI